MMPGELGCVLVARKEGDQGYPLVQGGNERMGFQDQLPRGHAADALQADQRIAHVIEDAGAEDEIETSHRLRSEVVNVYPAVFHLALEMVAREQEAVQGSVIPRKVSIASTRLAPRRSNSNEK